MLDPPSKTPEIADFSMYVPTEPRDNQSLDDRLDHFAIRLQEGDTQAWAGLYTTVSPILYPWILEHVENLPQAAETILSDTNLSVYENRNLYDRRRRARSWIFGHAWNHILRWRQSRFAIGINNEKLTNALACRERPTSSDPVLRLNRENLLQELEMALHKIKPRYRLIIELHFFQRMSYAEVAGAINDNQTNVRKTYNRGLHALRSKLPHQG